MELYRHSGRISMTGIPLTVGFGAVTASVCGIAYSYFNLYVGHFHIFFTVMSSVFVGLAVGMAVAKGSHLGKIRNPIVASLYGMVFGFVALYFAWVSSIWARWGFERVGLIAFRPEMIWHYMQWGFHREFGGLEIME